MFQRKTTQSILDTFTKDLQDVAEREVTTAALEADKISAATAKRDAALAEGELAVRAINNITALFTKE
jgi:hypothetical protein